MFTIDHEAPTPPFEQLRSQVIERVRAGDLVAGARLPTVRDLALQLHLAANTVARAYRELEASGIIETRGRNGTFVSAHGNPDEQAAQRAARDYADTVTRLGIDPAHALALVEAALRA